MGKRQKKQKELRFRLLPRNPGELHHPDDEERVLVPDFRSSKKVDWELYQELLKDEELKNLIFNGRSSQKREYDHLVDSKGRVVDDVERVPGEEGDFDFDDLDIDIEEIEDDLDDFEGEGDYDDEDGDEMPPDLDEDDNDDEDEEGDFPPDLDDEEEEGEGERRGRKKNVPVIKKKDQMKDFLQKKKNELFQDDKEYVHTEYDIHMFPEDGYDYRRHVSIGERGKFFPAPTSVELPPPEPSIDGNFDQEIMSMLTGDVEGQDDLDDDFLWKADASDDEDGSNEPLNIIPPLSSSSSSSFSYKPVLPKVERLSLRKNFEKQFKKKVEGQHRRHLDMLMKMGMGRQMRPEKVAGNVSKSSEYRQLLDEMFDQVMKRYDDEEIGELDERDPRLKKGGLTADRFESVFDEFLESSEASHSIKKYQEILDDHFSSLKERRIHDRDAEFDDYDDEESFSKRDKRNRSHLHSIEELDGLPPTFDPRIRDDDEDLSKPFITPKPKVEKGDSDDLLPPDLLDSDGQHIHDLEEEEGEEDDEEFELQVLQVKRKDEEWDCESILSTYSNLYNHPAVIGEVVSDKKKIKLKNGIPVGVLRPNKPEEPSSPLDDEDDEEEVEVVNKGQKRNTTETAEEKKARKKAAKEEKKQRRVQKKTLKSHFKSEEVRQTRQRTNQIHNNPAGMRL